MIISHAHRFIFFAVPKTATHAIRQALAPHLADGDWQQQALFGDERLPIAALAAKGHGHLSVREVRPHLPADVWRSYFKFAIVRNPYDRFISACFFLFRKDPAFAKSATATMKQLLERDRFRRRILIRPQSSLLAFQSGQPAVDYVGRYEDLQASFDEICRRIGLPAAALDVRNASDRGAYSGYYDRELQSGVAGLYREDLDNFGYCFDDSPSTN